MARPVWSQQQPDGQIRFGWDDGEESVAPANPFTLSMDRQLPDRLEGATADAVNPYDPRSQTSDYYRWESERSGYGPGYDPYSGAPPAPVASDATGGAGGMGGAPAASPPDMTGGSSYTPRSTPEERAAAGPAPQSPPAQAAAVQGGYFAPNPYELAQKTRALGSSAIRIKGGPQVRGWQEQYTDAPPEVEERLDSANDAENQAGQIELMTARKLRDQQAAQQRATDQALRYEEDQLRKLRERNLQRREQEAAKIADAQREVDSLRVNPDAYWQSKSGFEKVTLGLALALGAAGQALTGAPNAAKEMLDQAIKNNIDAQKVAIDQGRKSVEGKVNVYNEMLARFGDEEDAQIASQALLEKQAARTLARMANAAKDETAAAESLRLSAEYDRRAAQTLSDLHSRRVTRTTEVVPDRVVSTGQSRQAPKDAAARYVPGYGLAPTPEEAKKGRAALAANDQLQQSIARIRQLTASTWDRMSPEKRAQASSELAGLRLAIKDAYDMGALDKDSMLVAEQMTGNPVSVFSLGGRTAALDSLSSQSQRRTHSTLSAMGFDPARRVMTPTGPATEYTGEQPTSVPVPRPVQARKAGE